MSCALAALAVVLSGCEAAINFVLPRDVGADAIDDRDDEEDDPEGSVGVVVTCEGERATQTLEQAAERYASSIHPLFTRSNEEGGCIGCHAADSGRSMRVLTSATDTFYQLRANGFFRLTTGMITERVQQHSMPPAPLPAWSADDVDTLLAFSCDLAVIDVGGGTPLDELCPEGNTTYTGPAPTDSDNTILTYNQLRGRVGVVFDDAYVQDDALWESYVDGLGGAVPGAPRRARQADAEYLLAVDALAADVCAHAVGTGGAPSGPFAGVDVTATIDDAAQPTTTTTQAEAAESTIEGQSTPCGRGADDVRLCAAGNVQMPINVAAAGDYVFEVALTPFPRSDDGVAPTITVKIDSTTLYSGPVAGTTAMTLTRNASGLAAGTHTFRVDFTNAHPGGFRAVVIDAVTTSGPTAGSSTTTPAVRDAAYAKIATVFSRMLLRPARVAAAAADDERAQLYSLLSQVEQLALDAGTPAPAARRDAWAGVCEALMGHPDFLFTRPPALDVATLPAERERLLLVKTAFDLLDRPPTAQEILAFDLGATRADMVETWLSSEEFVNSYRGRVRELMEYSMLVQGAEEPGDLWAYVAANDRPMREVMTADYTVDANLQPVSRAAEHGATGILTMRGFIRGKPGLPHYNYAARVMTGFMGRVFEPPTAEIQEARLTATATSTVDPQSACYSCHQVLTPLAHQRLNWDDDGNYRVVNDAGDAIDGSDQGLVASYPFKGPGMESFTLAASKKEAFVRNMANIHFAMLFARNMRIEGNDANEFGLYRTLCTQAQGGQGTFKDMLRTLLFSDSYMNPPRQEPT